MAEYIERDLVIENVIDQMKHSSGESAMRERILNLPTADVVTWGELQKTWKIANHGVQPARHGRWIKLDMHRGMENYKCSACRSECYVPECMGEPMYVLCPNCGAKMDGDSDES